MNPKNLSRLALTLLLLAVSTCAVQAFPVKIDPQDYPFGYRINGSNRLFGFQTLDLQPGNHFLDNGANVGTSSFSFTVDAAGQITNISRPAAATATSNILTLQNAEIIVDRQAYTFGYRLNGSNRIFDTQALVLIPGLTFNLDSGANVGTSGFNFDVSATGQVTNITRPAAATAADNTLTLQNVVIIINPQLYTFGFRINASNRIFGAPTLALIPGLTFNLDSGASVGTSGFYFDVDAAGQLTNITNPVAATASGNTLILQNVYVVVNPQAYTFGFRINASNRIFGAPTLALIPGLTFNLDSGPSVGTSGFYFDVDATGQITNITQPTAASALGNTIIFANLRVRIEPVTYQGNYSINTSPGMSGTRDVTVVPTLTVLLSAQGQNAYFTATPTQVTPTSITLAIAGLSEVFRLSIDQIPPSTNALLSAFPNAAGWHRTEVTVTVSATDNAGGAGVKEVSYSTTGAQNIPSTTVTGAATSIVISAEGQTAITFFAKDQAGNIESAQTLTIKLDKTAPAISCDTAAGQWYAGDVNIPCSANDSLSGLASSADASFALSTSVPAGTETATAMTGSQEVCDQAGNCTVAGPIGGNKVDRKPPVITITSPASGVYLINQPVTASYGCTDGGSGVASCAGPVVNGGLIDTATAGAKSFTVTAGDQVANASTPVSVSYTVAFGVRTLYDQTKAYKSGSTIPIKLQLVDADGANRSSSAVIVHAVGITKINGNASTVVLEDAGNANPDNDFRYDPSLAGTGGYIFNLKTTGYETGTYELRFTTQGDPTIYTVQFQLKQ